MPHIVVTKKGSKQIEYFFKNGRRERSLCTGDQTSPTKKAVLKSSRYNFYWTNDNVGFNRDDKGRLKFDKTIDELTLIEAPYKLPNITHHDLNLSIEGIASIIKYGNSQIDSYVENNDSKTVLKYYGRIIICLCKIIVKHSIK